MGVLDTYLLPMDQNADPQRNLALVWWGPGMMSTASESWPWRWCRIYSLPFYYRITNGIEPGLPEASPSTQHYTSTLQNPSSKPTTSIFSQPEAWTSEACSRAPQCPSPALCTPAWGLLIMLVLDPTKRPFLTVISAWCQPLLHILAHTRSLTSPSTWLYTDKICSRSQSGLALITLLLGPL